MNKRRLLAAAVTGLVSVGLMGVSAAKAEGDKPAESGKMECHGGNECKGKGECGGPGHGCAGGNECRGKGWVSTKSKEECDALVAKIKGAKPKSKKKS